MARPYLNQLLCCLLIAMLIIVWDLEPLRGHGRVGCFKRDRLLPPSAAHGYFQIMLPCNRLNSRSIPHGSNNAELDTANGSFTFG